MLSVGEVARLYGLSVRALHHYDAIGLVKPSGLSDAGYRLYDDKALGRLQAVLFFKELGFSLSDIGLMLNHPDFDLRLSFERQRSLLVKQRQRLSELIDQLDASIGGKIMKPIKTTLADIEKAKAAYAQEAKERWGHTDAWKKSQKLSDAQLLTAAEEADDIFTAFAALVGRAPEDTEVQVLVKRWQDHISRHYYECTREILSSLGQMYVADERFTRNIDRFGEGTARLMSEAIAHYCR